MTSTTPDAPIATVGAMRRMAPSEPQPAAPPAQVEQSPTLLAYHAEAARPTVTANAGP